LAISRVENENSPFFQWLPKVGIACALAAWKLLIVATTLALILLFAIAWTEKWFGHKD
jgi:hypothetical protein